MTNAISSPSTGRLDGASQARSRGARFQSQSAKKFWSFFWSSLYAVTLLGVLGAAYWVRDEEYIVPKAGAGYWIGILGGLVLLSLLLYPLRKKNARNDKYGSVATWFRLHMFLGVLGPTLILLHSNFQLKSVNATVATFVMLTVVVSGLIGRFLYRKVHKGLHDKKAEVTALAFDANALSGAFGENMRWAPAIMERLKSMELRVLQPQRGPVQSLGFVVRTAFETRLTQHKMAQQAREVLCNRAAAESWSKQRLAAALAAVDEHLDAYFNTVRQAAELKFYSRLLGLWHVLHLPLYLMLIVAAVVHIVAVHLY